MKQIMKIEEMAGKTILKAQLMEYDDSIFVIQFTDHSFIVIIGGSHWDTLYIELDISLADNDFQSVYPKDNLLLVELGIKTQKELDDYYG